jgi:hypothetical protein
MRQFLDSREKEWKTRHEVHIKRRLDDAGNAHVLPCLPKLRDSKGRDETANRCTVWWEGLAGKTSGVCNAKLPCDATLPQTVGIPKEIFASTLLLASGRVGGVSSEDLAHQNSGPPGARQATPRTLRGPELGRARVGRGGLDSCWPSRAHHTSGKAKACASLVLVLEGTPLSV